MIFNVSFVRKDFDSVNLYAILKHIDRYQEG